MAVHRSAKSLAMEFYQLPFEPYAPIRRQMLNLLRAVNRKRKAAGFDLLPTEVLPLRRRIVKPFGFHEAQGVVSDSGNQDSREPEGDSQFEQVVRSGIGVANVTEHKKNADDNCDLDHAPVS
jgi:hypothetical protein